MRTDAGVANDPHKSEQPGRGASAGGSKGATDPLGDFV